MYVWDIVEDGSVIDTKGWKGWEWTHGVALAALAHVGIYAHEGVGRLELIHCLPFSACVKSHLSDEFRPAFGFIEHPYFPCTPHLSLRPSDGFYSSLLHVGHRYIAATLS
jgi:hypothetical protein